MTNPKDLHGKALASYIWDYYRFQILGALAGLGVCIYALFMLFSPHKSTALTIVMVGTNAEIRSTPEVFADFEELFLNPEAEELKVESTLNMDEASAQSIASYIQILNARFLAGEIDLVFAGEEDFVYIAGNGVFLDPQEYLTEDEFNEVSPLIVKKKDEDGTEKGIGISMKSSTRFREAGLMEQDAVVGIVSSSQDPELAHMLIEYLVGLPYESD